MSNAVSAGLRVIPQSAAPAGFTLGRVGLWANEAAPDAPLWRKADGSDFVIGAGGGGGAGLASAYAAAVASGDNVILTTPELGPVVITEDSGHNPSFAILSNTGATQLQFSRSGGLDLSASSLKTPLVRSDVGISYSASIDGASVVAHKFDDIAFGGGITTTGGSLYRWANDGAAVVSLTLRAAGNFAEIWAGGAERISGVANSSGAVAEAHDTTNSLVTAGALLSSWRNAGVQKAAIDKDGKMSAAALTMTFVDQATAPTLAFGNLGTDSLWMRLQPAEVQASTWYGWLRGFVNAEGTRLNQVKREGFNLAAGGGQVDGTRPASGIEFESFYAPGAGQNVMETHFPFVTPAGVVRRAASFVYRYAPDDYLSAAFQVDDFVVQTKAGANRMQMSTSGGVAFLTSMYFSFENNASPTMRQLNGAHNDYVYLPRITTGDAVELDPSGATSIVANHNLTPATAGGAALGTAALPWSTLHVQSASLVLHADVIDTNKFTLSGTPTGARTLTLPDVTDTLVGLAAAQTLTNKTLTSPAIGGTVSGAYTLGGTPTLGADLTFTTAARSIGDATHVLLKLATARIIGGASNINGHVVPDIADDTFALLAAAQTLTNKTISGASNTLSAIANASLTNSSVTVTAGTGLSTGGAVSLGSSVTLNLANTAVTPAAYVLGNFTVDQQGRLTAAASGASALAANQIVYATSASAVVSSSKLTWDDTNSRFKIGTAGPTTYTAQIVGTNANNDLIAIENTDSTKYSSIAFADSSGTGQVAIGWGNASVVDTAARDRWNFFHGARDVYFNRSATASLFIQGSSGFIGLVTTAPTAQLHIAAPIVTTGLQTSLLVAAPANTGLTLSTDIADVRFNLGRAVQFATGAKTLQRAVLIDAPTYTAVGATTITDAATLATTGAPTASTNITITRSHDLYLGGGAIGSPVSIVSKSMLADGASNVAHVFDTGAAYSTVGARIVSFKNNGTEVQGLLATSKQWIGPDGGGMRTTGGASSIVVSDAGGTSLLYSALGITVGSWVTFTRGLQLAYTAIADTAPTLTITSSTYQMYSSITAARIVTLPTASAGGAGRLFIIGDASGSCGVVNTITITRVGSDTIDGATTAVINAAYGVKHIVSDGGTKWTIVSTI